MCPRRDQSKRAASALEGQEPVDSACEPEARDSGRPQLERRDIIKACPGHLVQNVANHGPIRNLRRIDLSDNAIVPRAVRQSIWGLAQS